MKQAFRKSLAPFAAAAFTAFTPLTGNALAQEPQQTEVGYAKNEVAQISTISREANQYSRDNVSVTFMIVGRTENASSRELSNMVSRYLKSQGLSSREFKGYTAAENGDGAAISFWVAGLSYGPYGINDGVNHVPRVISEFREYQSAVESRQASLDLNNR